MASIDPFSNFTTIFYPNIIRVSYGERLHLQILETVHKNVKRTIGIIAGRRVHRECTTIKRDYSTLFYFFDSMMQFYVRISDRFASNRTPVIYIYI